MMILLLLATAVPFLAAALVAAPSRLGLPAVGMRLAAWAAVPALLVSLIARTIEPVHIPWLLLDSRLGLDEVGLVFLLLTSALWTAAGFYARPYMAATRSPRRFFGFFLLTMAGNLTLVTAQDVVTFYSGFALMSFSAYGLVVHDGSPLAFRAGKSYIVLAVVGEISLLLGLFLVVRANAGGIELAGMPAVLAAAPEHHVALVLLLVGFGIKAGSIPLHVWLPLAHPAAPTPASAVLSGAMIKAGLLGWLRFLPLGEGAFPEWGILFVVISLIAAFYAVAVGVTEENPKTVLAYSSISQMGLITVAIGVGFIQPAAWPLALPAVAVYALHHGFAKGALFLGAGLAQARFERTWARQLVFAGIVVLALAIAGAPLTSGAAAKLALKDTAAAGLPEWSGVLTMVLSLAAVGTTLLMCRFLLVTWRAGDTEHAQPMRFALWAPWTVLLAGVIVVVWVAPLRYPLLPMAEHMLSRSALFDGVWPVVAGVLIAWSAWWLSNVLHVKVKPVPAGDIQLAVEWMVRKLSSWGTRRASAFNIPRWLKEKRPRTSYYRFLDFFGKESLEVSLTRWRAAGVLLLALFFTLVMLLS